MTGRDFTQYPFKRGSVDIGRAIGMKKAEIHNRPRIERDVNDQSMLAKLN